MKTNHQQLEPSPWVMQQSRRWLSNGRVLDFACGYGRHSVALAERFDMFAVDRNTEALDRLSTYPKITTYVCDLESSAPWPFSGIFFDAVIVTNYLYRPKLASLFSLVTDGGYLAYETFANGNAAFGRPTNPNFLVHEGELVTKLPTDFEVIEEFYGPVDTPQPAVIQRLSARRKKAPLTT